MYNKEDSFFNMTKYVSSPVMQDFDLSHHTPHGQETGYTLRYLLAPSSYSSHIFYGFAFIICYSLVGVSITLGKGENTGTQGTPAGNETP